jgi:protein-glutamine gamma-glutamyltransferase
VIKIAGKLTEIADMPTHYDEGSVQRHVLETMAASDATYSFADIDQLRFELDVRDSVVKASRDLSGSYLSFSGFHDAKCNPKFWDRTDNGGFRLKKGVSAGAAVADIFAHGEEYATECATAMQIVYYKALLDVYGEERFDKVFPDIFLMDWAIGNPLMAGLGNPKPVADTLLGDRAYFKNDDVDPKAPWWQGENVIVLPDGLYYGHGVGIGTAEQIIRDLNSNRKQGATVFAHLLDTLSRPDFKGLARAGLDNNTEENRAPLVWHLPQPLFSV